MNAEYGQVCEWNITECIDCDELICYVLFCYKNVLYATLKEDEIGEDEE